MHTERDADHAREVTRNIYDPRFVAALFDEMCATYGVTNYVSSFGFCERWRRQAVAGLCAAPGAYVIDMMCGSGECWRFLARRLGRNGRVLALDLSTEMYRRARGHCAKLSSCRVDVEQLDALASGLPVGEADHVLSSFGLKTFSPQQLTELAREVWRLLKPGGTFSFVEIAMPRSAWLRIPYAFYLRRVIPLIGRCFLGNPDNYRMLAVYTERFESGELARTAFEAQGFRVRSEDLFFGCARRIVGVRGNFEPPRATRRGSAALVIVGAAFCVGAVGTLLVLLLPLGITLAQSYWAADSTSVVLVGAFSWLPLIEWALLGGALCALPALLVVRFWTRTHDE